jgi:hypothetical protein
MLRSRQFVMRRTYDPAQIPAAFGESVRDEVGLETSGARLLAVVTETMPPASR